MKVVGYSYDAAIYCVDCAKLTTGEDSEGNPVTAIFSYDEGATSVCGHCGFTLLGGNPLDVNFTSGDIGVWIRAHTYAPDRIVYEYRVELNDVVIAKGRTFETPRGWDEQKAAAHLLGHLALADSEMRAEHGWTYDPDALMEAGYLTANGEFCLITLSWNR